MANIFEYIDSTRASNRWKRSEHSPSASLLASLTTAATTVSYPPRNLASCASSRLDAFVFCCLFQRLGGDSGGAVSSQRGSSMSESASASTDASFREAFLRLGSIRLSLSIRAVPASASMLSAVFFASSFRFSWSFKTSSQASTRSVYRSLLTSPLSTESRRSCLSRHSLSTTQ